MIQTPTWDQFMAPTLRALLDGSTQRARAVREAVASDLNLSDEARAESIPSGQLRWENRALWALSYLARAGALDRPNRGSYRITDAGRALLASHPDGITERDLRAFVGRPDASHTSVALRELELAESSTAVVAGLDPIEAIEQASQKLTLGVAADLIDRIHAQEPAFFEQAVLDLLMKMNYGGADGRATRTRLSRDGGIDGVIDQDALGLSRVYVQAKRYDPSQTIGSPQIQAFVGALHGQQANQGVFITTAKYSAEAIRYADSVATRVVLIDGVRLASLMIKYRVGVQVRHTYEVVEVDEDYFE